MRDRIEINKEILPYRANIALGRTVFTFEFHYNSQEDCFVVHLYRGGRLLCAGEKLVYGQPLFRDCYEAGRYPVLRLVPLDESGSVREVTWDTLGSRVFLTVDDAGGEVAGDGR